MMVGKNMRRNQYQASRQPRAGVHDHVTNRPVLVVEVEVLNVADFAIGGSEFVSVQLFDAAQHKIALL